MTRLARRGDRGQLGSEVAPPAPDAEDRAHQPPEISWSYLDDAKRRRAHVNRAVHPRHRYFLDVVAGEDRLEAGLHVCGEVRLLDVEALENVRAIELQVVRHVAHAADQRQLYQPVEGAITENLEERVVDQHRLIRKPAADCAVVPLGDTVEQVA